MNMNICSPYICFLDHLTDSKTLLPSQIGDSKVTKVLRRGPEAVHIVDKELTVGDDYKCEIDWKRRFDHMQQHSGSFYIIGAAICFCWFESLP